MPPYTVRTAGGHAVVRDAESVDSAIAAAVRYAAYDDGSLDLVVWSAHADRAVALVRLGAGLAPTAVRLPTLSAEPSTTR